MTRPKKQTVDYFPHDCDCSNKKTLYILEQKYGNDGYAFWFKLLEILGSTEGHIIDCNNPIAWQFLQAKTRTGADICNETLSLLVEVGAIDKELWDQKYIWCDNFVDRIGSVYHNRRVEIPKKPASNGITTGDNPTHNGKNISRKPQTKLKETKLKETKVKTERKRFAPPTMSEIKDYILENNFSVDADKFYKYFTEGNWIDSKGNKVRNWKQKIITWDSKNNGQSKETKPGEISDYDKLMLKWEKEDQEKNDTSRSV